MALTGWRLQKSRVWLGKGEARTLVWSWGGGMGEFAFSACIFSPVDYKSLG
jgi:hypothetical protein